MTDENNIGNPLTVYQRLDRIDAKIDRLEARVNWLFGGLAILSVLGNFLLPIVIRSAGGTP